MEKRFKNPAGDYKNPKLSQLTVVVQRDPQHQMMIHHIENKADNREMEYESELNDVTNDSDKMTRELAIFKCQQQEIDSEEWI